MTKSQLIATLSLQQTHLTEKDIELAVSVLLEQVSSALSRDERIEIRGFGSFAMRIRCARIGHNPKTGQILRIPAKRIPHFKPGKELRERILKEDGMEP